jgi:hypothetical protein
MTRRCIRVIDNAHRGWVWTLSAHSNDMVWSGGGDAALRAWSTGLGEPFSVSDSPYATAPLMQPPTETVKETTSRGAEVDILEAQVDDLSQQRAALLETLDEYEDALRQTASNGSSGLHKVLAENLAPAIGVPCLGANAVATQAAREQFENLAVRVSADMDPASRLERVAEEVGILTRNQTEVLQVAHHSLEQQLFSSIASARTEENWETMADRTLQLSQLCYERVQGDAHAIAMLSSACGKAFFVGGGGHCHVCGFLTRLFPKTISFGS